MNQDHGYYLNVGQADEYRLQRLNRLYNPRTQAFLLASGLKPGMKVLDVGCGTGIMTQWIAQQVGAAGKVVGIDNSAAQLEIARRNSSENITYRECDVYDLESLGETFDFIYSRFVMIHLDKPLLAMDQMAKVLGPSGIMAITCGIFDTYFSEPITPAHTECFRIYHDLLSGNGRDINWGRKILPALKSLGCAITNVDHFMPILYTPEEKSDLKVHIKSHHQVLLDNQISTEEELNDLYSQLDDLSADPTIYCTAPILMMVAGRL